MIIFWFLCSLVQRLNVNYIEEAWRVFWLPFSLLLGMPKIARPLRIDVIQHTNSWSPNHFLIKNPYCCCFLLDSLIFVVE
jgi:hypothetical protein